MKNLKMMSSIFLLILSLASCQKNEEAPISNPNVGEDLAKELIGEYDGYATIDSEDYPEYQISVAKISNKVIRVDGPFHPAENYELERDVVLGNIVSFQDGAHFVVYDPIEKELTITPLSAQSSTIVFSGKKK